MALSRKEKEAEVNDVKTDATPELTPEHQRIAESRKALEYPLDAGQQFFEAPDGFIIVAEADRQHVMYRQGNGGKGMMINQRR